ncbi:DciA family protein [Lampropedia aestuarii]|nr:DciA family protein [Lampropedia aestuarii]MDH5858081.1 DciA family protein [Lampropedia aestuarii]
MPRKRSPSHARAAYAASPIGPARQVPQTHIGTLIGQSPLLTQLTQQASLSEQLLQCIQPALPMALRTFVQAGPIEGHQWCLIVPNSAAAAKLRHLSPHLLQVLQEQHQANRPVITQIRLRISATVG